jgi:hypothetical protein
VVLRVAEVLNVRVTPRSSREKVECGPEGLKVWVMASPTDGQANDAVVRVVAKALGIAPSRVQITRGHASRDKQLAIEGLSDEEVAAKLS